MVRKSAAALLLLCLFSGWLSVKAADGVSEFGKVQQKLKQLAPEAYRDIEKLASSDLEAAAAKLRELAGKHKLQLPDTQKSRRLDNNSRFSGGMSGRRGFNGRNGRNSRNGRGRMFGAMPGGNMLARAEAESKIQAAFPAESAAIDKLLIETEKKYAELAKKANVELPSDINNNMRIIRIADPAGFAEAAGLMKSDMRKGFEKLRELAGKHGVSLFPQRRNDRQNPGAHAKVEDQSKQLRQIGRPNMSLLRRKYPEEMKKYDSLRRSDAAAAKKVLEALLELEKTKK